MDTGKRSAILCLAAVITVAVLVFSAVSYQPVERDEVFGELNYVALGDSITYGADGETGIRMAFPYPCLVADNLGVRTHTNLAVGGATTSNCNPGNNTMLQLEKVSSNADIISVMIGVNDFNFGAPLGDIDDMTQDTVYGGLNLLAKGLKERCPDAFIFFMTPFQFPGNMGSNHMGYTLRDVADAVEDVCASYGIPVLDMYDEGGFSMESDPKCDTLHPTQGFFRKNTAPQISDFIRENYVA